MTSYTKLSLSLSGIFFSFEYISSLAHFSKLIPSISQQKGNRLILDSKRL